MKVVTVLAMALAELTRLLFIPTIPTLPRSDLADNEDPISRSKALLDQFVRDERVYLLHLEQLLESRTIIEKYELLHQDELNFIFKPVSVMMDSQIQFLLGIELILSASHENQSRARLFESWCEGPALPTLETFVKREKINRELLTIHLEASQANEKSLRILSTCRSLLSTPRFRLGKYHEFLNVRGHNRTLQRLEAKDDLAWPWESRSEKALLVSNTIQGAQAKMQTVIRIEEEREILRSVRTRVHEWDGLKLRMVDRVLLYDSFKAEDVQGNYTKGVSQNKPSYSKKPPLLTP